MSSFIFDWSVTSAIADLLNYDLLLVLVLNVIFFNNREIQLTSLTNKN